MIYQVIDSLSRCANNSALGPMNNSLPLYATTQSRHCGCVSARIKYLPGSIPNNNLKQRNVLDIFRFLLVFSVYPSTHCQSEQIQVCVSGFVSIVNDTSILDWDILWSPSFILH